MAENTSKINIKIFITTLLSQRFHREMMQVIENNENKQ